MRFQILADYLFALQTRRDYYHRSGDTVNEALYQRYVDAVMFATGCMRHNRIPPPSEAKDYAFVLKALFAPDLIRQLVPPGREAATYTEVSKLAGCMDRAHKGEHPGRLTFLQSKLTRFLS